MVLSQENIAQVDKIVLRWSDAQGPSYCNLSIKGGSVLPDILDAIRTSILVMVFRGNLQSLRIRIRSFSPVGNMRRQIW